MSAKVCLRCDWSGATAAAECPRCGAPLQGPSSSPRAAAPSDPGRAAEARVERSRWGVVATAFVLVLAAVAVVVVQRSTPPTPPAAATADLGYLVYAADDGGAARLWVWNVAAGTVEPGPSLQAIPTDLSFSYAMSSGWLSATVPGRDGISHAVVLRSLDSTAVPEGLGRGGFVTWLANGGYLTIASTMAAGGCKHHVLVRTSRMSTGFTGRSLDTVVCGRLTTLGRDLTRPYVTIERHGTATVYFVNYHTLVPVLRGYRALSVSLNGDLLVRRPHGPGDLLYDYPSGQHVPPTPIVRLGRPLIEDRVLSWSGDATAVYVLGSIGDVPGVYRITISPEVEPRAPTLIVRTDAEDVSASPTPFGDVYVAIGGDVTFFADGSPQPLTRPPGAPPVQGPLLWTSTLPYSRSGAG
jgi:hypothetical protein